MEQDAVKSILKVPNLEKDSRVYRKTFLFKLDMEAEGFD